MKFDLSPSNAAKIRTGVWTVFPLIGLLPLALFGPQVPNNIVQDNKPQLLISLFVYVLPLLWAYLNSLRAKTKFRTEYGLLRRVSEIANEQRRNVIQENSKQVLDVTRSEREPDYYLGGEGGSSGNETIASLMVQQLCKNAEEMRRDSDLTSQVFIRSFVPLKSAVQIPQQVALRIGILFTFAGLLIGLEPVAAMFQDAVDQRKAISELISGLTVAFGTSIAGLMAALMIQVLMNLVDHEYSRTTQQLESAWMDLGHVLSFARLEGDLPANVDRLSDEINLHREDVNVHTRNLIEQVDNLLKEGEKQREGVVSVQQAVKKNETSVSKLATAHEAHLTEFKGFLQEFKQLDTTLSNNLKKIINDSEIRGLERNDRLSGELKNGIETFNQSVYKHLESIQSIISKKLPDTSQKQPPTDELRTTIEKLNEQLASQHNEQIALITRLEEKEPNSSDNSQLNETLGLLNQNLAELQTSVQSLSNKKSSKLSQITSGILGATFACIALVLVLALIGPPAQETIGKIHSYLVPDNQKMED